MDDETLSVFAYVSISSYRIKALKTLKDEHKTPAQIAKDSDIRISHISNVLRQLKECGTVECINEHEKRNRIYRLTSLGHEVVDNLDDNLIVF